MMVLYFDRFMFVKFNIYGWGLVVKVFYKAGFIVT